jgi:hypothetical protein
MRCNSCATRRVSDRFVPHHAVCRVCLGLPRGHPQNAHRTAQCVVHDSFSRVGIRKTRAVRCLTRCAVGLPPTRVTTWFCYDSPGVQVHLVKKEKKKKGKKGNKNITTGRFQEGSISPGSLHAAAWPLEPRPAGVPCAAPCLFVFSPAVHSLHWITCHTALPLFRAPFPSYSPRSFYALVISSVVALLAPLFNFVLLNCANPSFESNLPKPPQISPTSRLCFSRQPLLQSFAGSTSWLQFAHVCLVRTDKILITELV